MFSLSFFLQLRAVPSVLSNRQAVFVTAGLRVMLMLNNLFYISLCVWVIIKVPVKNVLDKNTLPIIFNFPVLFLSVLSHPASFLLCCVSVTLQSKT